MPAAKEVSRVAKIIHQTMPGGRKKAGKKRVAAYARISCVKDAMLHSLSVQVSYFSNLIQHNPDWIFAGIYADEVTGTTKERKDFQRLLADCRNGQIDMIIVKSLSRFARNTVTLLETVRELKALGVDVFFEEQNIHSMNGDGELMLSILASFAQEESRSVSENCKWRIRNDFQRGKPSFFRIYGYKMKSGRLEIVPEEAEVVRMIFRDYLDGMGCELISKKLNEMKIPPMTSDQWWPSVIAAMLKNECYVGDLRLQKTFVADHLQKKQLPNRGELPQYLVHDAHEPIIDRETFDAVQRLTAIRIAHYHPNRKESRRYPFSGILRCDQCGNYYRRKITMAGTPYSKPVWICATYNMKGKKYCASKQIPENVLLQMTANVLELEEFDEEAFAAAVERIHVTGPNSLRYIFRDGQEREAVWQDHSRRDSWTDDMRVQAAAHARRRYDHE